jgi:hypothetical protein
MLGIGEVSRAKLAYLSLPDVLRAGVRGVEEGGVRVGRQGLQPFHRHPRTAAPLQRPAVEGHETVHAVVLGPLGTCALGSGFGGGRGGGGGGGAWAQADGGVEQLWEGTQATTHWLAARV